MARMDPHSYTDPGQGTVTRADLRLAVDFAGKRLHGEVTLQQADAQWELLMARISDRAEHLPSRR